MSFSMDVRLELAHLPIGNNEKNCCQLAELSGMVLTAGSVMLRGGGDIALRIKSECAAVARRFYLLIRNRFDARPSITVERKTQPKRRNVYTLTLSGEAARAVLLECGAMKEFPSLAFLPGIPARIIARSCCRRAFLRGVYLGCGTLASPDKEYHLEFGVYNESFALALIKLLAQLEVTAKAVARKSTYVVYIKEGEQISDMLGVIGAYQAVCNMANVRIVKDIRNHANRLVNAENANLDKTVNASSRHADSIEWLELNYGLDRLPPALEQMARVRLENRDATLAELGALMNPPLAKSAVNHRLRRIEEIARTQRSSSGRDSDLIR